MTEGLSHITASCRDLNQMEEILKFTSAKLPCKLLFYPE